MYKLEDLLGDSVPGFFYREDLVKSPAVDENYYFEVEKVIKKKKLTKRHIYMLNIYIIRINLINGFLNLILKPLPHKMSKTFSVVVQGNLKNGALSLVLPNAYRSMQTSAWRLIFNELAFKVLEQENLNVLAKISISFITDTIQRNHEDQTYFPSLCFVHFKGDMATISLTKIPFLINNFDQRLIVYIR